jgi:hypothetical protein
MSLPLDPKPCSSRTIFFGAAPERGWRLAPFTILDNIQTFKLGDPIGRPMVGAGSPSAYR